MPELPEVETLRRGLLPLILHQPLEEIRFFRKDLRFPIPRRTITREMTHAVIEDITRVGKYLLLRGPTGAMLWHLGMSGRVVRGSSLDPREKHTHAVFRFNTNIFLHFIDPRRFGCILWVPKGKGHPLLDHLGPDPLDPATIPALLKARARKCPGPIKAFLMNASRLAGVGNIYACEALFAAGIHPWKPANRLSGPDWERLLAALRVTLEKSIAAGGTTLRDFFNAGGEPGYFAVRLAVYGKAGQPCPRCGKPISRRMHTGRSTFYCTRCQKR